MTPLFFISPFRFFPFFQGSSKTGKLRSRALIVKRVLTQSNSGDLTAHVEHLYHHKEALGFSSESQALILLPGPQKKPIGITQAEVSCIWSRGPDIPWVSLALFSFQFCWVFYFVLSWGSSQG